ncbi:5-methylcytosine-specific restriction enzyme A [Nocardia farcinica]|uniref:Predicted restriction endonuclease n=2 Tax=Nocardia farcinica TaxID=37329 RepID=A0A0H5P7Y0_NOCFR|nr:HNH endonuclease [Nocardia farcinica]AXK88356.1 HNH endonuclease [Nocardia farcinica]MBA4857778.1 HNH endonuclease [Nocardia farcinica]MBC9815259.1 HNH endonuclease [Nocardia farcinica]MBF6360560.1 HNH endonuclease [Nocardia farcinica]CRY83792.1 Predicted restriction endonuclease [Nocardia farcinica]
MPADPPWTRDELILACDLTMANGWREVRAKDERAAELSSLLRRMPIHPRERRSERFRSVDSVSRKTTDFMTIHPDYRGKPTKGGGLTKEVLGDFLASPESMHQAAETIRALLEDMPATPPTESLGFDVAFIDSVEIREGTLLAANHYRRERNPKLRKAKLAEFRRVHSRVFCEVCGFDFEAVYGERGAGYIECHHIVPLHVSGETVTKLSDLVLLCSNCHRMIHHGSRWLSPEELREVVQVSGQPAGPGGGERVEF